MRKEKIGTYVSKKKMMTLKFTFASPTSEKTAIEIVYFTTFVESVEIGII